MLPSGFNLIMVTSFNAFYACLEKLRDLYLILSFIINVYYPYWSFSHVTLTKLDNAVIIFAYYHLPFQGYNCHG